MVLPVLPLLPPPHCSLCRCHRRRMLVVSPRHVRCHHHRRVLVVSPRCVCCHRRRRVLVVLPRHVRCHRRVLVVSPCRVAAAATAAVCSSCHLVMFAAATATAACSSHQLVVALPPLRARRVGPSCRCRRRVLIVSPRRVRCHCCRRCVLVT